MHRFRKQEALRIRVAAAELAAGRVQPAHIANGDEQKFRVLQPDCDGSPDPKSMPSYLASFTKGLGHNYDTGLIDCPSHFQQFVIAIDSGDPLDMINTPLGPKDFALNARPWRSAKAKSLGKYGADLRAWESQGAGRTFDLEGPDAQAVTMPPAPALGSKELIAEMGEIYVQALLRDVPFTSIVDGSGQLKPVAGGASPPTAQDTIDLLNALDWFASDNCCEWSANENKRRRGLLDGQSAFRGATPGDHIGPYISQFLLVGTDGLNGNGNNDEQRHSIDGYVRYGAITADQRVRYAAPVDYMTTWDEWYDVQQAANVSGQDEYGEITDGGVVHHRRFITSPRDLATYVHHDALYEAYLNACLILLDNRIPFDPDIPYQRSDFVDHQQGFAHFGGPHILSLVTEVATRALKAVRFQKFNVHRRMRPEALAARLAKHAELDRAEITDMVTALQPILDLIKERNPVDPQLPDSNYLLPMAFCEGSPMHPAYGAGHATVAGACVTILKAFFDHNHPLAFVRPEDIDSKAGLTSTSVDTLAFVPIDDGTALVPTDVFGPDGLTTLTVEGELNKLASNISIGRDWAGVHYYSDYIESLRMGEEIALGILEEQKLTYSENFSMTVPLFDGGSVRI
jgi:hypothetical protein